MPLYTQPLSKPAELGLRTCSRGAGKNLKEAIEEGGVVTFACPGQVTISMQAGHLITRPVTILGEGRVTLQIESGPAFTVTGPNGALLLGGLRIVGGATPLVPGLVFGPLRVFLAQGGSVTFDNTVVEGIGEMVGSAMAGGSVSIRGMSRFRAIERGLTVSSGNLLVEDSEFENWKAPLAATSGSVEIRSSQFTRTKLLLRDCVLSIEEAQFHGSDVRSGGGNGGAIETDCRGTISRTRFDGNKAVNGGALYVRPGSSGGTLNLTQVRFQGNEADANGGGAHLSSVPGGLGRGARLQIELTYSTFLGNSAVDGGGLYATGVSIRAGRFASNEAKERGGGVFVNGGGSTQRASFVGNKAGRDGGGVFAVNTSFANTLVVRNTAQRGGGIFGGNTDLVNVTVAYNAGGGLDSSGMPATFRLRNSLLANNTAGNCVLGGAIATVQSATSSMQFPDATCGVGIPVGEPYLDLLYAPVAGSPARSGGDLATCTAAPVNGRDLYGEPRPQGRSCSIGAVEGALDRLVHKRLRDPGPTPVDLLRGIGEYARQLLQPR